MDNHHVAFVGAYERDNFGDLLFPWVTERLLRSVKIELLSSFDGTVDHLLGRRVRSRADLLPNKDFDLIWSVGGEIGASTGQMALEYSFKKPSPTQLRQARGLELAYIPRPSQHSRTLGTPFVIHSAGLSHQTYLPPEKASLARCALREADCITVREQASSDYLNQLGIAHHLAPDIVAAIRDLHPQAPAANSVAVQVNDELIEAVGAEQLAQSLRSGLPSGATVTLFAAGIAPRHDSWHGLEKIRSRLEAIGVSAAVNRAREPLEIVNLISSARLLVATSLHCRIIACAYDVPRVSLWNPKVTNYAMTWDRGAPYDVAVRDLATAMETRPAPVGAEIASRAKESIALAWAAAVKEQPGRSTHRLEALNDCVKELAELGVSRSSLKDRLELAERGIIPFRDMLAGLLRRIIRRTRPALDFGQPIP